MEKIRAKVKLGLPLTEKEAAVYLLFIATEQEMREFRREYERD